MIIDCISDLHGHYPELEGGDLLIIAGDLTKSDTVKEHEMFRQWLRKQKYKNYVVIAGNHDNLAAQRFYNHPGNLELYNLTYLCDSGVAIPYRKKEDLSLENLLETPLYIPPFRTLKIWGSPWTKSFEGMNPKAMAFTLDTEKELAKKWALIPKDTNILITHSPSFGNYDWIYNRDGSIGLSVGSITLWMEMLTMLPNLKLHVTGHIHEAYGHSKHVNGIHLVNASYVNEHYEPINKPIRVIL